MSLLRSQSDFWRSPQSRPSRFSVRLVPLHPWHPGSTPWLNGTIHFNPLECRCRRPFPLPANGTPSGVQTFRWHRPKKAKRGPETRVHWIVQRKAPPDSTASESPRLKTSCFLSRPPEGSGNSSRMFFHFWLSSVWSSVTPPQRGGRPISRRETSSPESSTCFREGSLGP
jgi:hypothetical protein